MAEDTGYFPDMMPLPDVPAPEDQGEGSFPAMMEPASVEAEFPPMMDLPDLSEAEVQGPAFTGAVDEASGADRAERFPPMMDLPTVEGGTEPQSDASEIVQALGSIQQTLMQMQVTLDRIAEL